MLKKFTKSKLSSNESQNKSREANVSRGSSNSVTKKPTFKKLKLRNTSRERSNSAASGNVNEPAIIAEKSDRMMVLKQPATAMEAMPYEDMLKQNESFNSKMQQASEGHGIVRKTIKSKISLALNKNNSRGL